MFYRLVISMDVTDTGEAVWLATVPALPEITTDGATQDEARQNAGRAVDEALAARIADNEDIPFPLKDEERSGKDDYVEVAALTFLKCALYMAARLDGVSNAELARRLDWHREQVDRLFRIDHKSQLGQLEAAFKALGRRIGFDMAFERAA